MCGTSAENGSPGEISQLAAEILTAWARMVADHPVHGIESQVKART